MPLQSRKQFDKINQMTSVLSTIHLNIMFNSAQTAGHQTWAMQARHKISISVTAENLAD
jgi:hypothetical protein